jgi:hypothetical protein
MSTSFPTSIDSLTNPLSSDTLDSPSHSDQHSNTNDAIEALETKVGVDGSAVTSSHDYKLGEVTSTDKAVGKSATQTLTNKTIDGDNNTLQDIDRGSLTTPRLWVGYSSEPTSFSGGNTYDLEFDNVIWDTASGWSTTNYEYTVPTTGYYMVILSILGKGMTADKVITLEITKNGNTMQTGNYGSVAGWNSFQVSTFDSVVVGDKVAAKIVLTSDQTLSSIEDYSPRTSLKIFRIA